MRDALGIAHFVQIRPCRYNATTLGNTRTEIPVATSWNQEDTAHGQRRLFASQHKECVQSSW